MYMNNQEELKEWNQCLSVLGDATVDAHGNVNETMDCSATYLYKELGDQEINVNFLSSFFFSFFF